MLRGPQGTLYGAGSMGGTLRIIYKKPTFNTEASADATISDTHYGGFNYEAQAMVNLPVVSDKIAVRAVGFYKHNDGYIDNVYLHINNINSLKTYGGRLLVRLKPTERLTIDGAAYYNKSDTDTPSWTAEVGTYKTDNRIRLPVRDEVKLYSGTANYELGAVNLTGVVSYMDRDISTVGDTSRFIQGAATMGRYTAACLGANLGHCNGPNYATYVTTPINSFQDFLNYVNAQSTSGLYPQQNLKALTAELRLSSAGQGPVHWTLGGFYSRRVTNVANPQVNFNPTTGGFVEPLQIDTERFIHDVLRQVAAFADVSWDITPKLSISGGARYFKYNKDVIGHTDVPSILVGAIVTPRTELKSSEHGTVIRANLSYKFTRDIMFYFDASQGFRPGGVNQVLGLPTSLTPYRSDSLWDYEAGFKTQWLNRKLTINADVFRIDWSNIQVTQRTPNGAFSYIGNASAARVQGIEFDSSVRPFAGMTLGANATYMTAKLTEDQLPPALATASSGLKGNRIPYVPDFTFGFSAQYVFPLTDTLNGFLRGDVNHSSGYYSDFRPTYTFTRYIDQYELVNARVGVEAPDGRWGAYLFCNNLFDTVAITRASSSAIGVGLTSVTSATPRTIGLNVRTRF